MINKRQMLNRGRDELKNQKPFTITIARKSGERSSAFVRSVFFAAIRPPLKFPSLVRSRVENDRLPVPRIPVSTYRLQFNRGFTFRDAARIIPYLHELGITDIYASPYFTAKPGSLHGYDIVDHRFLNPDAGGEGDYAAMASALRRLGMGQVLDIVPNHMCVDSSENRWWQDVLENGPSSPYAGHFDIDWTPVKKELTNKVLLPVLGDQYGNVLERGELRETWRTAFSEDA